MDLLIERRGHSVWLRTYDSGTHWQAACDCGFRSEPHDRQTLHKAGAEKVGLEHSEQAPSVKKAKKATKRKK